MAFGRELSEHSPILGVQEEDSSHSAEFLFEQRYLGVALPRESFYRIQEGMFFLEGDFAQERLQRYSSAYKRAAVDGK